MLFALSFMVLDLIFLLPATKSMFEGFIQLTRKHKSQIAYRADEEVAEGRKSYIEKIYRFTMVFFILKAVFRTLPDFIALTVDTYTENSFVMYMYEYINTYRILAATVVLVLGIIWLCRASGFFIKLSKE